MALDGSYWVELSPKVVHRGALEDGDEEVVDVEDDVDPDDSVYNPPMPLLNADAKQEEASG